MIKKLLDTPLRLLLAKFDTSVDADTVREYVLRQYGRLSQAAKVDKVLDRELTTLESLLLQLGWIGLPAKRMVSEDISKRKDWQGYNWLAEDNCFGRDGLEPGCGQFLDWMDGSVNQDNQQILTDTLENLLRQVEVRRKKSLSKFTREISIDQKRLERCDVSILFSRAARRRHDLRFLNAAFKMNEWYMHEFSRAANDACSARLLIALAEQEISAKELLAC